MNPSSYNTRADVNNVGLMAIMHGKELSSKSTPHIILPSNVRIIMSCKQICIASKAKGNPFELVSIPNINRYETLVSKLLSKKYADRRLCVFSPGTEINDILITGEDPNDWDDTENFHGIFQLGGDFTRIYNTFTSFQTLHKSHTKKRTANRVLLSEMLTYLSIYFPNGFTLLLFTCRAGVNVEEFVPKGISLRKAQKEYKKNKF